MLDAIVQLVRNALCCLKDWDYFEDTYLYDPSVTAKFYMFPEPLNQTTPLELLISTTQMYAVVSTTISGFRLIMHSGYGKLRRVNRLIQLHEKKGAKTVDRVISESLTNERHEALKSIFIGSNVMSIGISFFWLFCNSLHITETDWIGGVQGLIHALTVMEVCLVPLLYYMLEDGMSQRNKSQRMEKLAASLKKGGGISSTEITAETYSWIVTDGWTPYWHHGYGALEALPDEVTETKNLNEEKSKLSITLKAIVVNKDDDARKAVMSQALQKTALRLEEQVSICRLEAHREFLYFFINFIAFYGYLLGVVVFYFEEEAAQPRSISHLKFGMANQHAEWHGNFAGDLMWTIEPIIILTSPMFLAYKAKKKVKVD